MQFTKEQQLVATNLATQKKGKVKIRFAKKNQAEFVAPSEHGLRTPNEAFFLLKSRTFGLGQINFGAFGVCSVDLSALILVQ